MFLAAKQHKKAAASVLVGACLVGGGMGYLIGDNSHQINQACQGANAANQTLIDVIREAEARTPPSDASQAFFADLVAKTRSHIHSCG